MTNKKPIRRKKLNYFIRTKMQVPGYKFAEFIGVSAATVQKWLYGEAAPSTNKIRKIAKDCGITFTEACELFDDQPMNNCKNCFWHTKTQNGTDYCCLIDMPLFDEPQDCPEFMGDDEIENSTN